MVISTSLVLIQGAESVLVDRAVSEILKARAEAEVTQLDGAEVEIGQFADATAPSLFSESRILVIKDMQDLVMDVQ
ncbi:MAG: DNA polymerase III subunit delta, partial [Actinobacteria bacterium]|nr:DNA polymerase III subunit delta [Actinomycetota bacterium]